MTKEQGRLAFIAVGALWGTVGICVRFLSISSSFLAIFRAVIGLVFIVGALAVMRRAINWHTLKSNLALLAFSGVAIGLNWLFLFQAYLYTSVAVATLFNYLAPIYVVVLSPLVLGERLNRHKLLAVALALIGMVCVSGILTQGLPSGRNAIGILCALASGFLYACAVFSNKKMKGITGVEMTIGQLFFAGAVVGIYLLARGQWTHISLDTRSILIILVVGIVHTGIAYLLYFSALEASPAQTAAGYSYIDPLVAIFVSWLIFSQPLDLLGWIGAALIALATIYADRSDAPIVKDNEST